MWEWISLPYSWSYRKSIHSSIIKYYVSSKSFGDSLEEVWGSFIFPHFIFPHNDLLQNFIKYFSHLFLITWFFPLILWVWWINLIDWLTDVNPILHFWDKTEMVMMCYLFDTFLNYLSLIVLLRTFTCMVMSNFIFLCFIWFWYQIMLVLKNGLKSILFCFLKEFVKFGIISSLNSWCNSLMKLSGPVVFFVERIFKMNQILKNGYGEFNFLILLVEIW